MKNAVWFLSAAIWVSACSPTGSRSEQGLFSPSPAAAPAADGTTIANSSATKKLTSLGLDQGSDLNLRITAGDGTTLAGYVIVPLGATDQTRQLHPTVLLVSPYGVAANLYLIQAARLALSGYIVVGITLRGIADSGGYLDLCGENDLNDARTWIDWTLSHTAADPQRLAMAGVSHGACVALLTAARDDRVRAAGSLSGWSDFGSFMRRNGTAPGAWATFLKSLAAVQSRFDNYAADLIARNGTYQVSDAERHQYADHRSPLYQLDTMNRRDFPVFMHIALEDNMFWVDDGIRFFNGLTNSRKQLRIHHGEHASNETPANFGLPNEAWDDLFAWLGEVLKGDAPAPRAPIEVAVQNSTQKISIANFADVGARPATWQLAPDALTGVGTMGASTGPYTAGYTHVIANNKVNNVSPGLGMIGTIAEATLGLPYFKFLLTVDPTKVATFASEPFAADQMLFGGSTAKIWVQPSTTNFQLNAYLYRLDVTGTMLFPITHGPVTTFAGTPDQPELVTIPMIFTACHLGPGERLVLALGTYDPYYQSPNDAPYALSLISDAAHPSTLGLSFLP